MIELIIGQIFIGVTIVLVGAGEYIMTKLGVFEEEETEDIRSVQYFQ